MRKRGSGRSRITRARQFVQRRKALTRVLGVLLAIPVAVAAFYVILLSWSTLMRVKWVNGRSRQFTKEGWAEARRNSQKPKDPA